MDAGIALPVPAPGMLPRDFYVSLNAWERVTQGLSLETLDVAFSTFFHRSTGGEVKKGAPVSQISERISGGLVARPIQDDQDEMSDSRIRRGHALAWIAPDVGVRRGVVLAMVWLLQQRTDLHAYGVISFYRLVLIWM
jgi:hypothetical protein